jgi:crotonobetainyl-CoA:carnitine CoA-transferase CaiB-like acyl-CoA transferase
MSHPLNGVRVLELGQIIAGTYGGLVLSDLGAEVIKVEPPEGELGRNPSVAPYRGWSGLFLTLNRNKKSVVLNLKSEEGRQVFYDLVRVSDVVVDNFRPGVLERLKIDYPTLSKVNPRIVQCSVTGFGTTGSYKDLPSFDVIIQAISGHMAATGEPGRPPVRAGVPLADLCGGIYACKGVLAALFDRERTGLGRLVEISMFDCMLGLLGYIGTMWLTNGELPDPPGSSHEYMVPWQAFPTADGYVVVATREESFWKRLCALLDRPSLAEDPRFVTNRQRVSNKEILVPILESVFRSKTTEEWVSRLRQAQVPVAPVNHFDRAFAEPPVAEREMVVAYDHPEVGLVRVPGNPIKISGTPGTISEPAPLLGEHTADILARLLEYPSERIEALRHEGAVG